MWMSECECNQGHFGQHPVISMIYLGQLPDIISRIKWWCNYLKQETNNKLHLLGGSNTLILVNKSILTCRLFLKQKTRSFITALQRFAVYFWSLKFPFAFSHMHLTAPQYVRYLNHYTRQTIITVTWYQLLRTADVQTNTSPGSLSSVWWLINWAL